MVINWLVTRICNFFQRVIFWFKKIRDSRNRVLEGREAGEGGEGREGREGKVREGKRGK
jgi:hypothetical protein